MNGRNGLGLIVGAVAALMLASSAFAAGPIEVPVSFDLSSATCSQLPPGTVIHGDGTAQFSVSASGNVHSVIKGEATDGNGGAWRFNYSQDVRPLGGDTVELTDHFNLVGSGSGIKLHSHFVADFSGTDPETAQLIQLKQIHGDPIGCDPI